MPCARHIEIQHFAIQEWRAQGDIVMEHLSGLLNPSDDMTKALGWVLHSRHARRNMGHYLLGSPDSSSSAPRLLAPHVRVGSNEAGEGVGAQLPATSASPGLKKSRDSTWDEQAQEGLDVSRNSVEKPMPNGLNR